MAGPGALTIMNRSVPIGTQICAFYSGPADPGSAGQPDRWGPKNSNTFAQPSIAASGRYIGV
jgi:hypothetical protein